MAEDNVPHWQTEEYKRQKSDYDREYYRKNKEKVLARQKAAAEADPDGKRKKDREAMARFRARQREINPPAPEPTPLERFNQSYVVDQESGCWIWQKTIDAKGYAIMKIHQTATRMHRWAYAHFKEPIPDGYTIDHLCHTNSIGCKGGNECRHRRCVNPEHLEVVSAVVNTQRGKDHYWANADLRRPSHCPNGHPYVEGNIIYSGDKKQYRSCRTCVNENQLRRYHARNGTAPK